MQKEQISDWTPASYHFFRVCLGFYFFTLWSRLLPWGPELFSCEGLFSTPALSPFWGYFPSLFFYFDSPSSVLVLQGLAILASLSLIFNKASRSCAFYLWLFLASAYNKNPLISNPSLAYLGWVLLAHSFSPTHPLPLILRKSLWWLLVTGYSIRDRKSVV